MNNRRNEEQVGGAKNGANEASTIGIHGQTIIRLECRPLPHYVAREADLLLVTIVF